MHIFVIHLQLGIIVGTQSQPAYGTGGQTGQNGLLDPSVQSGYGY